jgi:hypothetical protein
VQIKQKKSDKAAASKQAAIDKAYNKIKMNLICCLESIKKKKSVEDELNLLKMYQQRN